MKCRIIAAVTLICANQTSHAIVNVESMRIAAEQPGYSGHVDLGLSGKRGNTDKDDVSFDTRIQHHHNKTTSFAILSYDYSETSDARNTNKYLIHARHVHQFQERKAWEGFAQLEENEFARLTYRRLLGGGLRFTLAQEPEKLGLYLGAGVLYAWESLEERPGLTDHGKDDFARANLYLSYKHKINDQLSFVSTTYYQPRFDKGDDYRALEQATIAIKMTDNIDFKLSLDIAHDSAPPQTIDKTDLSYTTSISYKF